MNNSLHVCPDRDIECGHNSDTWCSQCPKWRYTCKSNGGTARRIVENPALDSSFEAHARRVLHSGVMTMEESMRRAQTREFHNLVAFGHSGSSADALKQAQRLAAFDRIRKLVNGTDLDGVLAKIRTIANDCP